MTDLVECGGQSEAPGVALQGSIDHYSCKADPAAEDGGEGGHYPLSPSPWDEAKNHRQSVGGRHQVAQQVQADDVIALNTTAE